MAHHRKLVLAGGSGFLGQALVHYLTPEGWDCVVLSRHANSEAVVEPVLQPTPGSDIVPGGREVYWDAATFGSWGEELEGADALINLAGRSIDCRPTARNRQQVLRSRLDSVGALGAAVAACDRPPPLWVQASAVGIYGDTGDAVVDESTPVGAPYPASVCSAWEAELAANALGEQRVAVLRIGVVLDNKLGALPRLAGLARRGLGGRAGNGRQWLSWLHVHDLVRVVEWILDHPQAQGVYNVCAPEPHTNAEFQRVLRHTLGARFGLPAPAPLVRIGAWLLGSDANLALQGCRAVPRRLQEQGFEFAYPALPAALSALLKARATR